MKKKKGLIEIKKSVSYLNTTEGTKEDVAYWSRHIDTNLKSYSITKMLGGKDNVVISKWWTHHGYGGWVYEHQIKDLEVAKQALVSQGWDYRVYQDIYRNGCFIERKILEESVAN